MSERQTNIEQTVNQMSRDWVPLYKKLAFVEKREFLTVAENRAFGINRKRFKRATIIAWARRLRTPPLIFSDWAYGYLVKQHQKIAIVNQAA